jgi:hypothetical protein
VSTLQMAAAPLSSSHPSQISWAPFPDPLATSCSGGCGERGGEIGVTVRVFVMLGKYFVSVKYVFVKCKACVCLCKAFENLKCR